MNASLLCREQWKLQNGASSLPLNEISLIILHTFCMLHVNLGKVFSKKEHMFIQFVIFKKVPLSG
jgi:hypothetical protein